MITCNQGMCDSGCAISAVRSWLDITKAFKCLWSASKRKRGINGLSQVLVLQLALPSQSKNAKRAQHSGNDPVATDLDAFDALHCQLCMLKQDRAIYLLQH